MGIISEIFNFDNVGGKIKGLTKWSCWFIILFIWIAAPISFVKLVSDDRTIELFWIPIVAAIVGPIFVWIGSWVLYAFGEFVEDTHAMNNKMCRAEATQHQTEATDKRPKKETIPQPIQSSTPKAAPPKPQVDMSKYVGQKRCRGCGGLWNTEVKECTCGSAFFTEITEENVWILVEEAGKSSAQRDSESIPICKCGAIPDKVGNQYVCPVCCRKF